MEVSPFALAEQQSPWRSQAPNQTCLSVSELLASRHGRAVQASPQGRHRRVSDGQQSDDWSKQVPGHRKSLIFLNQVFFPTQSKNTLLLSAFPGKREKVG